MQKGPSSCVRIFSLLARPILLSISSAVHAQSATEDIKAKAQRLVAPLVESRDSRLQSVATFEHQVTGVTVAPDGRIFVNFPRWTEDTPVSVAELMPDGSTKPYPNEEWNALAQRANVRSIAQ